MKKKQKANVIGLHPVPPDAILEEFIKNMIGYDHDALDGQLDLLDDAVKDSNPDVFAYARMLNFLASETLSKRELVHLCAAAMWRIQWQ